MPDPDIAASEVDEIIVTASRPANGALSFAYRYRTSRDTNYTDSDGSIRRARIRPNATITFVDTTGELPNFQFQSAIPAVALQELIDALTAYGNRTTLSAAEQTALADLFGAFDAARDAGVGIQFTRDTTGQLGTNDLMGAVLTAGTFEPVNFNGYWRIIVNPQVISNPRSYGLGLNATVIHELLHLNTAYNSRALTRFQTGRGNRPFNQAAFNEFHQNAFWNRAEQLRRVLRRVLSRFPAPTAVIGTTGSETLTGSTANNELYGVGGNDTFVPLGVCDFVWGTDGDDRYIYGPNSQSFVIFEEGGNNVLEIQLAITTANIRIGTVNRYLIVGIVNDSASTDTAYDVDRFVHIPLDASGSPKVQTLQIGQTLYSLPSLAPLNNSRPELIEPNFFEVDTRFGFNGDVGYIVASDRDGDPLTYQVMSVTGLGDTAQWSIVGTMLKTNLQAANLRGQSNVLIRVSDGRAYDELNYRVYWRGNIRQ